MAALAAPPEPHQQQQQQLQQQHLASGAEAPGTQPGGGGGGHALRARSMPFDDDFEDEGSGECLASSEDTTKILPSGRG